jgi:hypothetical protein
MARRLLIASGAILFAAIIAVWCFFPFKLGELSYTTPMSPENLVLVRSGSEERVASHLRGVADYVSKLGPNLKVVSYTRTERPPLSRFLPFPHNSAAPFRVIVEFSDERGDRYTAIFSGEIGFEPEGLVSPPYIARLAGECIDTFLGTVFGSSPDTVQRLLRQ